MERVSIGGGEVPVTATGRGFGDVGELSPLPGEASEPEPTRSSWRRASSNEEKVEMGERLGAVR